MPYVSDRQRRWAHTEDAKRAGFPTKEFDEASKGKELPEQARGAKGKMSETMKSEVKRVTQKAELKDKFEKIQPKKYMASKEDKYEYVSRKGKAPSGPEFEAWLEKKLGGDHSDSGYMRAFPEHGDQTLKLLKPGELSIPQKQYLKETAKPKSVQVGVGPKEKAAAVARVKANMAAEEKRRARKEADIESF
jgi:hypothetical protein